MKGKTLGGYGIPSKVSVGFPVLLHRTKLCAPYWRRPTNHCHSQGLAVVFANFLFW